jgi:hypothetical protein
MLINSSDIKKHAHTEGKQSYNVLFVKYETLKCRFGVLLHHGVSKCFCVLFPYWTCLVILCNFSLLNSLMNGRAPAFCLKKPCKPFGLFKREPSVARWLEVQVHVPACLGDKTLGN